MGLFANRCENPDCDAWVKKAANFCSKCGYAGPDSLTTCSECQKKVGRTSRHCWNCGADIALNRAPRVAGERWVRDEAEFAVRVYPSDLDQSWLNKRITVEAGTVGVVEKNGRVTKDIEWGRHTLDGILKMHSPTSIILINTAGAVLRPTFRRLQDKNGADFEISVQLILKVADHDKFVAQYFEGHKRRVTYQVLEESISHELHDVIRGLVCIYALEEMHGNISWRNEFEEKIRANLSVTFNRTGLELLQVNFTDFGGDHFEQLRKDRGEQFMGNHAADVLAEKMAIRQRVYALEAQGKLGEAKTQTDVNAEIKRLNDQYQIKAALSDSEREEAVAQCLHELAMKNQLRAAESGEVAHELAKAQADHEQEILAITLIARGKRDATEDEFRRERERLNNAHALEEAWKADEHRRRMEKEESLHRAEVNVRDARTNLEAAKLIIEQKKLEAVQKHQEKKDQTELLILLQKSETDNLVSLRRLDLEEKKIEADKEVSIVSVRSKADAEVNRVLAEEREKRIQEVREDAHKHSQDMVTMSRNQSVNVVQGGAYGRGHMQADEFPCPVCNRPVPINYPNCPWCKHPITK